MMQDMFHRTPLEAAAVVSLISIFNASGRFLWASASDYIGRRNTYTIFFVAQFVLFLLIPGLAASGNWIAFEVSALYRVHDVRRRIRDDSGVSRRHLRPRQRRRDSRRAADGVERRGGGGPVIITELSNRARAALAPGADRIHIYDTPLQVLAGLLAVGFVLTLLVRPLRHKQLDSSSS